MNGEAPIEPITYGVKGEMLRSKSASHAQGKTQQHLPAFGSLQTLQEVREEC